MNGIQSAHDVFKDEPEDDFEAEDIVWMSASDLYESIPKIILN